jgi:hypothetical protein
MVISTILSRTNPPQYVASRLWKDNAHFRTATLPAVAGPLESLGESCLATGLPFDLF